MVVEVAPQPAVEREAARAPPELDGGGNGAFGLNERRRPPEPEGGDSGGETG